MADDHGTTDQAARQRELLATAARLSEDLARTLERSADVHEQMPVDVLASPDRVQRQRRLAAAERAAAEAFRAGELPPQEVREELRQYRTRPGPDGDTARPATGG